MGSALRFMLCGTLVFPAEISSSYPHFITSRSPCIEAFELGQLKGTLWHPSWVNRTLNGKVDLSCW